MTIVVLLASRKSGGHSPWVAVRHTRRVIATGLDTGDVLAISYRGAEHAPIPGVVVDQDCELDIPRGAMFVCVDHIKASGNKVSVDLR